MSTWTPQGTRFPPFVSDGGRGRDTRSPSSRGTDYLLQGPTPCLPDGSPRVGSGSGSFPGGGHGVESRSTVDVLCIGGGVGGPTVRSGEIRHPSADRTGRPLSRGSRATEWRPSEATGPEEECARLTLETRETRDPVPNRLSLKGHAVFSPPPSGAPRWRSERLSVPNPPTGVVRPDPMLSRDTLESQW